MDGQQSRPQQILSLSSPPGQLYEQAKPNMMFSAWSYTNTPGGIGGSDQLIFFPRLHTVYFMVPSIDWCWQLLHDN